MKIIVIGGGQVGTYIAKLLIEAGNEIKVIEPRQKSLKALKSEISAEYILDGDGADPKALEEAGIMEADLLAAVTGADEINLVASTIAKFEFGVKRVIARVNNPKNEWLFTSEMGVDVKISQADLLARVITDQISMENIVTLMRLNHGETSIVEVTVNSGSKAEGVALKEIPTVEGIVLVAIHRGEEHIIPREETILKAGDRILAYAENNEQSKLYELMH